MGKKFRNWVLGRKIQRIFCPDTMIELMEKYKFLPCFIVQVIDPLNMIWETTNTIRIINTLLLVILTSERS